VPIKEATESVLLMSFQLAFLASYPKVSLFYTSFHLVSKSILIHFNITLANKAA